MHQKSDVARVWAAMKVQAAPPFATFSISPFSQIPVKTGVDTADTLSVKPNPCQAQGWCKAHKKSWSLRRPQLLRDSFLFEEYSANL